MRLQDVRARLRWILVDDGEFAAVIRGAGQALVIRVLASAVGYASMILLARWMGASEFGHYSFALAWMTLLAYPATLGLPGTALRFGAEYTAAGDWPKVIGLLKASSWIAFGCGMAVALAGIAAVLSFNTYLDPGYVGPIIVALAGVPVVALAVVRSEAIRGLGWLGLGWAPLQLGQPLSFLLLVTVIILTAPKLSATMAVGAAILAYAAMLIVQRGLLHMRLAERARVEPTVNIRLWLGVARSFLWIYAANMILAQAGVIMIGFFLTPVDVAIYSAAALTSLLVTFLLQATNALSAPKFAELYAQARHVELQTLFTGVVRWTFWPSLAVAMVLIAFGSPILRLFGPDFDKGHTVLAILTLGQLANVVAGPVANLFNMTGHQAIAARVIGSSAVVYALLGLLTTPIWGAVGTALALVGATLLSNVWLAILVVRKLDIYPSLLSRRP